MKIRFSAFATLLFLLLTTTIYAQNSKRGVLVLAHGGTEEWNSTVDESISAVKEVYPVTIAYGMADPKTLEKGIRELEAEQVDDIVIVPLFVSSHSFILRQTEYFLGMREELADPLILMDHSNMSYHKGSHSAEEKNPHHSGHTMEKGNSHSMEKMNAEVPAIIETSASMTLLPALDDHDVVVEILKKRISGLSQDPTQETIIIVGHGPVKESDNTAWVGEMESITDKLRASGYSKFKNIFNITVRDDADEEIYNMAKENLRSLVRQSSKNSQVIVVPLLLSRGGIEKGIVKRLEGLDYRWDGTTLMPDPLISEYVLGVAKAAPAPPADAKTRK